MTQENPDSVLSDDRLARIEKTEEEIESILSVCNVTKMAAMPVLRQSIELSTGISKLKQIMNEQVVRKYFMPLQGSKLGFLTDKDKSGGYGWEQVRDALIEGMIRGLRPVGNEINIIADNMYAAVNGVERLVVQFPGLTDLWIVPGVPQSGGDKGAYVPMRATWILNRQPMEMVRDVEKREDGTVSDTRICVKVNSGMGPDAIIGKARRKMLFSIYQRISNCSFALADAGDPIDTVGALVPHTETAPALAPPEHDGRRMRIGVNKPSSSPTNTAPTREPGQEG
jgi:hypothetical protein